MPPNKELKLTKPCAIGASQLNSSVRQTVEEPSMPTSLPMTDLPPVIRTDFSDDTAWSAIKQQIETPAGDFRANVAFVDDATFNGATPADLLSLVPSDPEYACLFVVDKQTVADADHPILVLAPPGEDGAPFRVVVRELWAVENNLTLANMDFEEFADAVDPDGVFRGVPEF